MQSKRCYGCDRSCHSLLTANCGHKTCFYCIKNNRSANKCSKCNSDNQSHSVSPIKNKSIDKIHQTSQDIHNHKESSSPPGTDRYIKSTHKKQAVMRGSGLHFKDQADCLVCPQHREPLSMFCKSSKQILCSVCLCKKPKYNNQILPLKNAQEFLKKEARIHKEEARIAQSDVQNAWRTVNKNRQAIEQSIETHKIIIKEYFQNLSKKLKEIQENSIRICTEFLQDKVNQYGQISLDLHYLGQTLRDFRQNCRDNNSLNELTYLNSSFKVIKKTIETLSFDYISYEKKNLILVDFDRDLKDQVQRQLVKFKLSLPIKTHQKNSKSRSASTKSTKNRISPDYMLKSKHKLTDPNSASNKKHKFSLCSNGSIDYGASQENLYKKLLKAKYKF